MFSRTQTHRPASRVRLLFWLAVLSVVGWQLLGCRVALAQQLDPKKLVEEHVIPVLRSLGEDKYLKGWVPAKPKDKEEAAHWLNAATWNMLLGEILAVNRRDLMLWSGAVDSLEEGLMSLRAFEDTDRVVQDELFKEQRLLATKFDLAIARREEIQKKLNFARDAEWKRAQSTPQIVRILPGSCRQHGDGRLLSTDG